MEALSQLSPASYIELSQSPPLLLVQANLFQCGGIAIGMCLSHKIADAASFITFIKGWVNIINLGNPGSRIPFFGVASRFPPIDPPPTPPPAFEAKASKKPGAATRLVFEASKIAALKARATDANIPHPTRVEVVSALIWKCVVASSRRSRQGPSRASAMIGGMNMRAIVEPPLHEYSFGNVLGTLLVVADEDEIGWPEMVRRFRKAVTECREQRLKDNKKSFTEILKRANEIDVYFYSSWCRNPMYEADFGWGKPTWVSYGYIGKINKILLMDTEAGDGIQAWVTLNEEEVALLERDQELLEFALLNPIAC